MNEKEAKALLMEVLGSNDGAVPKPNFMCFYATPTVVCFDTDWLPSLPQLVELTKKFGVPFEALTGTASNGSSGCETCGYGSSVSFEWRIELK